MKTASLTSQALIPVILPIFSCYHTINIPDDRMHIVGTGENNIWCVLQVPEVDGQNALIAKNALFGFRPVL